MQKRSSKQGPEDVNEIAFRVLSEAINDSPPPEEDIKNPAAVALGRLGGQKGGKARAAALSADERSAIAKKAAAARWSKSNGQQ